MIKQVIIIRRDLKMRRGKEIAQGSHASMMWLSERIQKFFPHAVLSKEEWDWIKGTFTKVVCQIDSEESLKEVHQKALDAGLTSHIVIDSGKTEFNGVPTPTAVAIGPNEAEKIDEITKTLKLY